MIISKRTLRDINHVIKAWVYLCSQKSIVSTIKYLHRFSSRATKSQCLSVINMKIWLILNGPLARYVKFWVAHALGMPGTFSMPPRVSDPDKHYGTCVTHVPWCMSGSLTGVFHWSHWRGKRSRHSRRMRNPQLYVHVSGKRPMAMYPIHVDWLLLIGWTNTDILLMYVVPYHWKPYLLKCTVKNRELKMETAKSLI